MSAIKIDACDELFSLLTRERAEWACEACGKYYPEGQRQGLHCSHYITRAVKATRWHPLNSFAHCFACHNRIGGNPPLFTEWVIAKIGAAAERTVYALSKTFLKLNDAVRFSIKLHLKRELDIMRQRRANGETGRLDFKAWDGTLSDSAPRKKSKPKKSLFQKTFKRRVDGTVVKRGKAA